MSTETKSPEKSLSYMAWSMKEMAESLKQIVKLLVITQQKGNGAPVQAPPDFKQDEIQF